MELISVEKKIEFFFTEPKINPNTLPDKKSMLYLLRRDISVCFKIDPTSGKELKSQALWPGTMGIMAGIDLLAKYLSGKDNGSSGYRFKNYISKYFSSGDPEVIYQLRNSLLHSFGLYSRKSNGQEFFFSLGTNFEEITIETRADHYKVDIKKLLSEFENSIKSYRSDLIMDKVLKSNFEAMFKNYSTVIIRNEK